MHRKNACTNCIHFVVRQVFNAEFADLYRLLRELILGIFFSKHMEMATSASVLNFSHEANTTIKISASFN